MNWENNAACRGADPKLFEEIKRGEKADAPPRRVWQALAYCHRCTVVAECKERRDEGDYQGVWGGEWWPDSKAPTGYSNSLLKGRQNYRKATTPTIEG